jgi:hypothetical protein
MSSMARPPSSRMDTMSLAFVVEVNSDVVGLAVRDGDHYRFHAVAERLLHLEGQLFASPLEAERVARQVEARQARSVNAAWSQSAQMSC